jgi:hypothetical protein
VRGYVDVGGENPFTIPDVLGGPTRFFIPVTGGFIKGVGPCKGLEAEVNPASSDSVLVSDRR